MAGWSQLAHPGIILQSTSVRRARFWWTVIGRVLSTLLHSSSYSEETRARYDEFFARYVIPLLGPPPNELNGTSPVSFMCDDHTPVELAWVFKPGGETVQYAFDPVSPTDGRPMSTAHSLNMLEHLAICGQVDGFDSSWSRICHETLTQPTRSLSNELQNFSQFFIGIDLAPTGIGLKTYFVPVVRSRVTGSTPMDLVTSTVEKLGMRIPWKHVTSYLNSLPAEHEVTPVIVAVDCVEPSENRFKVYVRTQATDLASLCGMLTLGGRLEGSAINATVAALCDLWRSLFGNIDIDVPIQKQTHGGPTGFLFYYEMAPNSQIPIPKIYIPAGRFCSNDAEVARAMVQFVDEDYPRDVQALFPHRNLASRAGIHSHITLAAKKGGCQVSAYFNPEAYSQDI